MKKNIFVKYLKYFFISILFIFLLFAGVVIATINTIEEGYQVNFSETKAITAHSVCKQVTNNHASGLSIFVPTKTAVEWSSFYGHPPAGVTIADCVECRYDHANPAMAQGNYYYVCDCSYCGSDIQEPTLRIYWDGNCILNQMMSTRFVCPDSVIIGNYKYSKGLGPPHYQTEFEICREHYP